jgi:hypothetical protein
MAMRRLRLLGVSLLSVLAVTASSVGVTGAAATGGAAGPGGAVVAGGAAVAGSAAAGGGVASAGADAVVAPRPRLREISAVHRPGFDRLTFRFTGGLPERTRVRWTDGVSDCTRGLPVRVAGNAVLAVDLRFAEWTVPVPGRRAFALPNLATVVPTCQFEGVLGYGAGYLKRTEILRTLRLENPSRFVVDVSTRFPKTRVRTYFLDADRFADGTEPYIRPVWRWVPRPGVGNGALHRLYAGPTPAERVDALRLVRSRSTGFRDLTVAPNQVARVRLTGGCSSGGSTFTVANLISPTLKQFPTVRWVKIYDPAGTTESPTGQSDSIPECLEP